MANELRAKQGPLTAATQSSQEDQTRDSILFTASLTNRVAHGSTLVVGGWARDEMRGYLLLTPSVLNGNLPGAEPQVAMQSQVIGAPDHFWQQIGWGPYRSDTRRSTMAGVLSSEQLASLLQVLKETDTAWLSNISVATNRNEERFGFGWSLDDDQGAGLMMGIDTYPRIASDGQSVDLELRPSRNPSETDIHSSMRAR
jgi:hypothetical protein